MSSFKISDLNFSTQRLQKLGKLLDQAKAGKIVEIAAKAAKPQIEFLIARAFDYTQFPEGESWQELKKPKGLPPLAGLKDFIQTNQSKNQVVVTSSKYYAVYHQYGTKYIPARSWLPSEVIPAQWQYPIAPHIHNDVMRYLRSLP